MEVAAPHLRRAASTAPRGRRAVFYTQHSVRPLDPPVRLPPGALLLERELERELALNSLWNWDSHTERELAL